MFDILSDEAFLIDEDENLVFISTYKKTTGTKSSLSHAWCWILVEISNMKPIIEWESTRTGQCFNCSAKEKYGAWKWGWKIKQKLANEVAKKSKPRKYLATARTHGRVYFNASIIETRYFAIGNEFG